MRHRSQLHTLTLAALFAAAIAVTTAYILHIPLPTGGYVHVGDALLYLAACLLPTPWAMAAGAVGGAVADLLTAPMWAPGTFVIKAVLCLFFTAGSERFLTWRNSLAVVWAGLLSPTLYALLNVFFMNSWNAFWPQFVGTFIQGVGSGVVFFVLAAAGDRVGLKRRLETL